MRRFVHGRRGPNRLRQIQRPKMHPRPRLHPSRLSTHLLSTHPGLSEMIRATIDRLDTHAACAIPQTDARSMEMTPQTPPHIGGEEKSND